MGFYKVVPPETNPGFFYNTPHNSVYYYLLNTYYHKNHAISVIFVCLTQLCILPWSHVDCRTLCIWAIWTAVRCTWERWEWRWCIYWVMSSCGRKGLRLSLWPGQSGNIFLSSLFKSFLMFDVFLDINGALALHRNLLFFFFSKLSGHYHHLSVFGSVIGPASVPTVSSFISVLFDLTPGPDVWHKLLLKLVPALQLAVWIRIPNHIRILKANYLWIRKS